MRASYKMLINNLKTSVFVNGDNLTAVSYSINEGFPMPGAIFMAGIDINF
jgi:iron complex outermembrane receptor protein